METHTITMDKETALEKYKAAISEKHVDSYEFNQACAAAYEHLARGSKLLSLSRSIQRAGLDENGMPRLAIARADRREVYFRWQRGDVAYFTGYMHDRMWNLDRYPALIRYVDMGIKLKEYSKEGYALVPAVPADVRPKTGQLRQWYILWEVDEWYKFPKHMKAPVDPILLEHIGGDLYAVIAEWDLTEVERLILEEMNV